MKNINTDMLSDGDKLKAEVLVFKPYLPREWRKQFLKRYPEYDNRVGIAKLSTTISLRSMDAKIVELLKEMFPIPSKKSKQNA